MGLRGPAPKPEADRQRRNKPKALQAVPNELAEVHVPKPPVGLSVALVNVWADLFESPVAQLIDPYSDMPALHRLFQLYNVTEVWGRIAEKDPVISGPKGNTIMNPILDQLTKARNEILRLEDRFGMSPKARLSLGVTLGQAKKSLDDLNHTAGGDDDFDPYGG